ncbi:HPr family phosphocarrier protein [Pseudarthrobacter sp. DSP2-3-2b1]|uniref:HPr family phosphocarrier protein n=1 Tax=Pseudarthrobacter sp. DSP2-3-2b1 TaxID=2804661 RepID=UPI003CFA7174
MSASIGLHARPAAVFVRAVTETGLPIRIRKAGIEGVDARSLLEVMTADFEFGCEVELSVPDNAVTDASSLQAAEVTLQSLAQLLESQGAADALPRPLNPGRRGKLNPAVTPPNALSLTATIL